MTSLLRSCVLFFVFLTGLSLSTLSGQESSTNLHAPIAIFPSVTLSSISPGTPEERIIGATTEELFSPIFLAQENRLLISAPIRSFSATHSDHEYANEAAFAAILEDGSIYAWGDELYGGFAPFRGLAHEFLPTKEDGTLKKVKSITSNQCSFVATLEDDSLWQWGYFENSFFKIDLDGVSVSDSPSNKKVVLPSGKKAGCCIASTALAFAVILNDYSLYAWGLDPSAGKTPILPKDENGMPKKPCCLYSNHDTFTAVFPDKTLLAWGNLRGGGKYDTHTTSLPSQKKLQSCCSLASTRDAFAGILEDGSLFVWGKAAANFKSTSIPGGKKPLRIMANDNAFSLLLEDTDKNQSLLCWGPNITTSQISLPRGKKMNAGCCMSTTSFAFAATLDDGSIFAWGDPSYGGSFLDQPKTRTGELVKACCIVGNDGAFSALLEDGSIVTWGNYWYGGTYFYNHGNLFPFEEEKETYSFSSKASCIVANHDAFSAILSDGSLLAWGSYNEGGTLYQEESHPFKTTPHVGLHLAARSIFPVNKESALSLVANGAAFGAVTDNGSLLKWGFSAAGGGDDQEIPSHRLPSHECLKSIATPLKKEIYYYQNRFNGIALITNKTSPEEGKWQFLSPGASTWLTVPQNLSERNALTLSPTTKIRFVPKPDFMGNTISLIAKVLDVKATIMEGGFIDTTLEPYTGSCSANNVELTTTITPIAAPLW